MAPKTEETSVEAPAASASAEPTQSEKITEVPATETVPESTEKTTEKTTEAVAEPTQSENAPEEPEETIEQKTERAKKLYEDGKRAFLSNSFSDSSKNLAEACELYVELYTEFGKECADLYLFYGKTLLELSRMEGDVFTNALTGVAEDSAEEMEAEEEGEDGGKPAEGEGEAPPTEEKPEETQFEDAEKLTTEEREEIHEKVEEALEENAEALASGKLPTEEEVTKEAEAAKEADAATEEIVEANSEEKAEDVPEEPTSTENDQAENEETEKEGDSAPDDTQEVSNLQLAYENLDMCRIICEKNEGDEWKQKLAECRLTLGEVAIDDERYSDAEDELTECLSVQKSIYSANDRRLAETLFQMGRARSLSTKFTEAADSYKAALDIIKDKLEEIKSKLEKSEGEEKVAMEKEVGELTSLVPDIEAKISDCEGSAKAAAEMKENGSGDAQNGDHGGLKPNEDAADKPIDTITHLVRKPLKRSADEELQEDAKKVREETENGAGDATAPGEAVAAVEAN